MFANKSRRLFSTLSIITIFSLALSGISPVGAIDPQAAVPTSADENVSYDLATISWEKIAQLTASDAGNGDEFGRSVAISGDTILIGASTEENFRGSAYVYEKGAGWANGSANQVIKLTASDRGVEDYFGISAAISGDIIVLGAQMDDIGTNTDQGSAYVFEKLDGIWTQTAKLVAADGASEFYFGNKVAVSGNTIVVGSIGDDENGDLSGSAFIFEKLVGSWTQTAKLTATDGAAGDTFGSFITFDGTSLVISATHGNDNKGAVYIFEKLVGNWTQTARLTASDGAADDNFNTAAISGDTILVGAAYNDDHGDASGSAYIFEKPVSGWEDMTETVKLTASDAAISTHFGTTVAINGDTAVVCKRGDNNFKKGAIYIFEKGDGWENGSANQVDEILDTTGTPTDGFGMAVAMNADTIVVGSIYSHSNTGSAYIFALPATTYTISGNAGVAGASLDYTDVTTKTVTADGAGDYSFTVSNNWSGTVTPSLTGYTFSPASRDYTDVLLDQTGQDYTATAITYTISGNAGVSGASLGYTDSTPQTAIADGVGDYSFEVSYNWSGTVTPALAGYTFSPASRDYTDVLLDQTGQDYSTTATIYTISGNAGVPGASLDYTDITPKTAIADGVGNYTFEVSYNWSGIVTPSKTGYTFSPVSTEYTDVLSDQTGQDYTATMIQIPTNLIASDGKYTDRVQLNWTASGADSYDLFRATSAGGTKIMLGSPTVNSFADNTAIPGITYYYWVKGCHESNCSAFSAYNTGWRKLSPPVNIKASDGTYTTKVQLTWNTASGASIYKIYRATRLAGAKTFLASRTGTSFADTTATPGLTYFYWVRACKGTRCSLYSAPNTGWRKLSPPTNLQASDGTYANKVEIKWSKSNGATSYKVYRSNTATSRKVLLGSTNKLIFNDTKGTKGVTYYYWVRAYRGTRASGYSAFNTGWR